MTVRFLHKEKILCATNADTVPRVGETVWIGSTIYRVETVIYIVPSYKMFAQVYLSITAERKTARMLYDEEV